MKHKSIKFITGLHGNELNPVIALANANIPQIIANPKALAERKRFINVDMNKSFGAEGKEYEYKRCKEVLSLINPDDYVIDFHTTSANTEPFAIVVDKKMIDFAMTTGLKHIVYMKFNIKEGRALINHCNGISVEVGDHEGQESVVKTLEIIKQVQKGKKHQAKVYQVFGTIEEPGEYINFEKHKDGFIPVLAGSNAYKFYGLKAELIES